MKISQSAGLCLVVFSMIVNVLVDGSDAVEAVDDDQILQKRSFLAPYLIADDYADDADAYRQVKRQTGGEVPGVLRFGKRAQSFVRFGRSPSGSEIEKKEIPGVLRFGKRGEMPGVLRFGKRPAGDVPGVLRFGKRSDGEEEKKSVPGVLRFGKRDIPQVLRFGKREMPGVLRFGKRFASEGDLDDLAYFEKKSPMPGVLRFG